MTALPGSPRRVIGVLALVAATGVLAGFTPWPISRDSWREAIRTQLAAGLKASDVRFGDINLTFLPRPRIEITDLSIETDTGPLFGTARRALLPVALVSLLSGKAEATAATLEDAALTLRLPRTPTLEPRDMTGQVALLSRTLGEVQARAGLGSLAVARGTLTLADAHGGTATLDEAHAAVAFHAADRPVTLALAGRWNGAPARLDFSGAPPARLADTAMEPVNLLAEAGGVRVEFSGTGRFANDGALKGVLRAAFDNGSPVLAAALSPLGIVPERGASVSALIDGAARGYTLSDLSIDIHDDRFSGVGAVRYESGRWQASATLATDRADLSWAFAALARLRDSGGSWNFAPISTEGLVAANLDLRLSAERLKIANSQFERAALTLLTRPARFEVALGEARLNGGAARARLIALPNAEGMDVKMTGSLDGADLGTTFAEAGLERRLRGIGSASLSVDASGRSMAELVASSNGRVQLSMRGGDLIGIDLNRLAERRPGKGAAVLAEALSGRTPFESLSLQGRIVQGAVGPIEGRMQAGRIVGALQGTVDLSQGQHKLGGNIVQIGGESFDAEPVTVLEFSVNGPLTAPRIEPNLQSLLNRS